MPPTPSARVAFAALAASLLVAVPASLQTILDSPIIVRSIALTTGATRVVRGVRRGYIEGFRCPRSGSVPVHGEFSFSEGVTTESDTTIACG